jgi:WD40 repeat protein/beta-lactamase regulating signal transducer with metallopeptidase domain
MSTLPLSLWLLQLAADFTEVALVWLVQSTVILLVGLAAGRLLARRGPALESALYRTTLVAVVACPLAAWLFSAWGGSFGLRLPAIEVIALGGNVGANDSEVKGVIQSSVAAERPTSVDTTGAENWIDAEPARHVVRDASVAGSDFAAVRNTETAIQPAASAADSEQAAAIAVPASSDAARSEGVWRVRTTAASFAVAVALVWLGTLLVLIGRRLTALRASANLVRRAVPAEPAEQQLCAELAGVIDVRAPRLLRTALVDSPCLIGLAHPVILLPEEPPGVPLHAILVHELAHLRRGDHLWNLAARLALAMLFFQPLLWWLRRRLEVAAEEVCDDHVVHFGADRTRYANGLVTLAEQSALPLASIGVPLVTLRSLLARRVRRILDHSGPPSLKIRRMAVCGVVCGGLATTVLGGFFGAGGNDGPIANAAASDDARVAENDHKSAQPATLSDAKASNDSTSAADEPLPAGAIARLGTTRFRPTRMALGVSFLPDGRTLVQTTGDGHLEYWHAELGLLLRTVRLSGGRATAAHHSANGRFIALRGFEPNERQRRLSYWVKLIDAATGGELMSLDFPTFRGEQIAVSADGSAIIGDDERLCIIDTKARSEVRTRRLEDQPRSMALSPDAKLLAVGGRGKLLIWKWASDEAPKSVPIQSNPRRSSAVLATAFSPDGAYLAAGADDFPGITLLDANTGKEVRRFTAESIRYWHPRSLAFSSDGAMLAAPLDRNAGGGVLVWDVATGKLLKRLDVPHESVNHIAFSADGRLLAGTGGRWDRQMCVWNISTGERLGRDLPGHSASPSVLRFLPGDRRMASAGDDGTIRVWNVDQAQQERVLAHERDPTGYRMRRIHALDVSPDGKLIASSSGDDTVRVWETDTGNERYRLPGHGRIGGNRAVRFTPDGRRLVSWGDDMRVYVWDIGSGKALNEYRAKLPEGQEAGGFYGSYGSLEVLGGVLSPDASRLLLLRSDLHLFDVATGKEIAKLARTVRDNTGLAISPDNQYAIAFSARRGREIPLQRRRLASSSEWDFLVQLRNLADGELVAEKTLPELGVGVAAFSPDSRQAAITAGGENASVLIVSVPEFEEIARIEGLGGGAHAVEFSRSGKRLAVANVDTTILVYDLGKLPLRSGPAD